MGPAQVPEGFIATPVLQDALDRLVGFMEGISRAGLLPVAPAMSQAWGGVQTPDTRTPEPVAPQAQVPAVQPVVAVQPAVAAQPGIAAQSSDGAAMSPDAL